MTTPADYWDYDSEGFWRGLSDGRLMVTRCVSCGYWIHPARHLCPECWSADVELTEASARGTLYTYVSYTRPYRTTIALVELEGQPGLRITGLLELEAERPQLDMDVRLDRAATAAERAPVFGPD